MLKAIIFDMDGVLTDSERYQQDAERYVLSNYGVVPTKGEWESFTGRTNRQIFTYIQKAYCLHVPIDKMIAEKRAIVLEKMRTVVEPIPGAMDYVKMISSEKKLKIGLVTSSIFEHVEVVLSRFGIFSCFDAMVTGDEVMKGKPDPEPYLMAIEKLGVDAASCVVIEDSINGMKSARSAGAKVIGITTTFTADIIKPYCDWVAASYKEIQNIVDNVSTM